MSTSLQTFSLLSKLPTEIQIQIFEHAAARETGKCLSKRFLVCIADWACMGDGTAPPRDSTTFKTIVEWSKTWGFCHGKPPCLLRACRLSRLVMLEVWKRYISEIVVSHGDEEIQETTRQGWALVEWKARLVDVVEVKLGSVKEKMKARRLREVDDLAHAA